MGGIGPWQILIIVLIILLLFGASKLPTLARSAGRSMRIFKSEMTEMKNDGQPSVESAKPTTSTDGISDDISAEPEFRPNNNQSQER
ncbi:MAG: Sec-independent protein translocase subunit TatA [Corynebacterium sp.]|uniref:Sec-independent protein translocase protein TatA n=1 Tax=Corynebacterium glyciniphilum AJ 3170 TaxID=1404245 RepID=X5EC57_9CORY|nr:MULTISPECIES: Sec-independent protein translocase subunit TatA [Corynebacterium]AHW64196.1 Hypothetical protein CGLY_08755 [Corynebacterium glyciniphilum AJ 3170]OLT50666.1 hypothetical protein BJF89_09490 [Corynebacterium sp. CNJ-954]